MGNKRTRSRLYDHKRDDKMKGHTKRSQQQFVVVQETSTQVQDGFFFFWYGKFDGNG